MNFALMGGYYFWTATDLDHGGRTACMAYSAYLPRRQQWTRLRNIWQLPPKWRYQGAQPWPTRSCQPFSRSVRSTRTARCQPAALESAVTPSCHFTALAGMQVRSRGPSSRTLHIYIYAIVAVGCAVHAAALRRMDCATGVTTTMGQWASADNLKALSDLCTANAAANGGGAH